ncbi:MAG: phosphoribosylglycinamide formyltransferase [Chloroflexota bacterium]|nr:phosphoribosylglycinamide formyltransferase [Chloroflexota bacterium]
MASSSLGVDDAAREKAPFRVGVLVSGKGTNLQAILDAVERGELAVEVALVVCNHKEAGAIDRARRAGVPVEVHEVRDYPSRAAQQQAIADRLEQAKVDLVVCAGWDRVLEPQVVRRFAGRIINVHPSLLPAFGGGLHAIEDALQYGVKITGCTVHFVTEEVDTGPIISQAVVPVLADDTHDTLAERIHAEEHRLLVEAISLYSQGKLEVDGRVVLKRET